MIKDMLFGDSYNPLIVRAYQGDTLIYERSSPTTWDFEVQNVDFVDTKSDKSQLKISDINPFSPENMGRDFEIILKGTSTLTAENGSTIGIFSRDSSGTGNGPYNIELTLNVGNPGKLKIWVTTLGGSTYTHNSTGNDKEIKIIKTYSSEDHKYYFTTYVEDVAISQVFSLPDSAAGGTKQQMIAGGCQMSSFYGFTGHLDYFKFRFTS